jgi:prepilin-type N-terminal cleavage/methylation domain-containing protein
MFGELRKEDGVTLLEVVTVLILMGIIVAMAAPGFSALNSDSRNGALQFLFYVSSVRAEAVASTSSLTVSPTNSRQISVMSGNSCDSTTQTSEVTLGFTLPDGASFTDTGWSFCMDPHGISDHNIIVSIEDERKTYDLEIMLGGAVELK